MLGKPRSRAFSPWPHRVAVMLVCVTFPLIWVGGLVTTYDAGMAVDDWPTTYGYNLFLYPWTTWVSGPWNLFIEHGHRLLGALAGIVTIGLVGATWYCDRRRWVRWWACGALGLVCAQGVLGGARVLLDDRTLALVHGCVGPAFFAYAVTSAVITSRWWHEQETTTAPTPASSAVQRLAILTAVLSYLQIVLGAHIRHVHPDGSPETFRFAVLFHVIIAFLLLGHCVALVIRATAKATDRAIRVPARGLAVLVTGQICLGATVWIMKFGWPIGLSESLSIAGGTVVANSMPQALITTLHVAMGSLILATVIVVLVRSLRFFRVEPWATTADPAPLRHSACEGTP